jgi:hypothetical protein
MSPLKYPIRGALLHKLNNENIFRHLTWFRKYDSKKKAKRLWRQHKKEREEKDRVLTLLA